MHKKAAVVILSTAIAKVYLREPDRFTFSQKSNRYTDTQTDWTTH